MLIGMIATNPRQACESSTAENGAVNTVPAFSRLLEPGEPIPWFRASFLSAGQNVPFDKMAGRHILLFLFGTAGIASTAEALDQVRRAAPLFDGERAIFFGVSADGSDVTAGRIAMAMPGFHFITDQDRAISQALGAAAAGSESYRPHWLLLDPALRILARFGRTEAAAAIAATAAAVAEPAPDIAPVLKIGHVLEPELCRRLVALYEEQGGIESGVMRQVGGRTVAVMDHRMKRRADCEIEDPALRQAIALRIQRRLVPMIQRTFQFEATRIERYIVACYDAATNGHFNAHRDNTTLGTAHRRFAVTINLNDDYDGGDLRFPEWGPRTYRAPVGGAVVFSCSMLHEATAVTAGRRYATLPFLYDEPAAAIREANLHSLHGGDAPDQALPA